MGICLRRRCFHIKIQYFYVFVLWVLKFSVFVELSWKLNRTGGRRSKGKVDGGGGNGN